MTRMLRAVTLSTMFTAALISAFGCNVQRVEYAQAEPEAPRTAAVVWWQEGGAYRSAWVEAHGDEPTSRERRPEAVIATGNGLWAFRRTFAGRMDLAASCACVYGTPEPHESCAPHPTSIDAEAFVRLSDGRVVGAGSPGSGDGLVEFGRGVDLESSLGGTTVIGIHDDVYACGAHGIYSDAIAWIDLDERLGPLPSPVPASEGLSRLISTASQQFSDDEEMKGCIADPPNPELYAAHLAFDHGNARLAYEFTTFAPYYCGEGPGHYSRATTVPSSDEPPVAAELHTIPAFVTAFLGTLPKNARFGGYGFARNSDFTIFASAPIPPPKSGT